MTTTHIHTESIPRERLHGSGEFAEIVNRDLCGAENVVGVLRWLSAGDRFAAEALAGTHQLIYLMEGEGTITLGGEDYEVVKGAGVYLAPSETASIRHRGSSALKLFHLVVPVEQDAGLDA